MRIRNACLTPVLLLLVATPVSAQKKPRAKAKTPQATIAELKTQVTDLKSQLAECKTQTKAAVAERDALKGKADAAAQAPEEIASLKKSRDLARAEADDARRELESLKEAMGENKAGNEGLLRDLKTARQELGDCTVKAASLKQQLEEAHAKLQGDKLQEGSLVPLGSDIVAARPINLNRVRPSVRRVTGVVVVNVLISEKGDVLETRLLQGLPGNEDENVKKAHEACLDAAKRLVFDPARTADGKIRVKVWQGVGFHLD